MYTVPSDKCLYFFLFAMEVCLLLCIAAQPGQRILCVSRSTMGANIVFIWTLGIFSVGLSEYSKSSTSIREQANKCHIHSSQFTNSAFQYQIYKKARFGKFKDLCITVISLTVNVSYFYGWQYVSSSPCT